MRKRPPVVYGVPVDDAPRWPWYRWIPNAYRGGRRLGDSRRWALLDAVTDWWRTR